MTFQVHLAPMMGITNCYYRSLIRLLSPSIVLTTEMVPLSAIMKNKSLNQLKSQEIQPPLTLQIGGSSLDELKELPKKISLEPYDQININAGCPSKNTCAAGFGVVLFKQPKKLADMVSILKKTTDKKISVKTRLGVNSFETSNNDLFFLIEQLSNAGIDNLILHARIAKLGGLNPKQNLSIPKIDYETVLQVKKKFTDLPITVNGEIATITEIDRFKAAGLEGVMIGRGLARDPLFSLKIEKYINPSYKIPHPSYIIERYLHLYRKELDYKYLRPLALLSKNFKEAKNTRHILSSACSHQDEQSISSALSQIIEELANKPDFVESSYSSSPNVTNWLKRSTREKPGLDYISLI